MVGSGTAQDPFQVVTASDLQKVASGVDGWDDDAHYVQVADIDMEQAYFHINVFNGVYDGRGHVIENVKATGGEGPSIFPGFCITTGEEGIVRNVILRNSSLVVGARSTSGFVYANNGIIENCVVEGAELSTTYEGAGFVYANNGIVKNCFVIDSTVEPTGFVGVNTGIVESCFIVGCEVKSVLRSAHGFVINNQNIIKNCYSFCKVESADRLGLSVPSAYGFVFTNSGEIENCYYAGELVVKTVMVAPPAVYETTPAYGFCAQNTGTITACYYDSETSNANQPDAGGVPKTTAQMHDIDTFSDWDIALMSAFGGEIWFIDDGKDYPRLGWEYEPPPPPPVFAEQVNGKIKLTWKYERM